MPTASWGNGGWADLVNVGDVRVLLIRAGRGPYASRQRPASEAGWTKDELREIAVEAVEKAKFLEYGILSLCVNLSRGCILSGSNSWKTTGRIEIKLPPK